MIGIVYKSTGSWYIVKTENGQWWNARIKGVFLSQQSPLRETLLRS